MDKELIEWLVCECGLFGLVDFDMWMYGLIEYEFWCFVVFVCVDVLEEVVMWCVDLLCYWDGECIVKVICKFICDMQNFIVSGMCRLMCRLWGMCVLRVM